MEDGLVGPSLEGTPQGGIVSPLWTNIYLNEFDQWHWNKYTGIPKLDKKKRRYQGIGNAIMTRYADDFIVLTNANHDDAVKMKEEIAEWFPANLSLELNLEKTQITHVTDGWDFLGFHLQYRPEQSNRTQAWLQVVPSHKGIQRVRDKIREITSLHGRFIPDPELFMMINAIVRGWANYYRYVNSAKILDALDWWLNDRILRRMMRHRMIGITEALSIYKRKQTTNSMKKACNRWNLKAEEVWLFKASDIKIRRYFPSLENWQNPYLSKETNMEDLVEQGPMVDARFTGMSPEDGKWLEVRREVRNRDNHTCQECGSQVDVEVHHRQGRISNGKHSKANCITLCKKCHAKRTQVQMASKRETDE
jgi:RNA-directed DNA polymerase